MNSGENSSESKQSDPSLTEIATVNNGVEDTRTYKEYPKQNPNRAVIPPGWVFRARRKDGKTDEYWEKIARRVVEVTGIAPVDPKVFQEQTVAKFAVFQGYTTLDRLETAIKKCEEKLATPNLSEDLQIEWMTALRGVFAMQREHLQEIKASAALAEAKSNNGSKPKNLPPSIVLQQNFNGTKPELKRVDSLKEIGEG